LLRRAVQFLILRLYLAQLAFEFLDKLFILIYAMALGRLVALELLDFLAQPAQIGTASTIVREGHVRRGKGQ